MYETQDRAARRRAAIAAEKERLARDRARRSADESPGVSGFAQRKWRWLGVDGALAVEAVSEVLEELIRAQELPDHCMAPMAEAITGKPHSEQLLPAVRAALQAQPPATVLRQLRALWVAQISWFTDEGTQRLRLICSTAPDLEIASGRGRQVSGGPAFSLFATAVTRGAVPLPNRHLDAVVSWAPLEVIDDLVDQGGLLADDVPWQGRTAEQSLYLRARLIPARVSRDEAEALQWTEYLRREGYLAGETLPRMDPPDVWGVLFDVCADGDTDLLDMLDALLPRAEQVQLRDILSRRIQGDWPREILADQGMWLLLSRLWRPSRPVNPRLGGFYALVAANRAYDMLKEGDLEGAAAQADLFENGRAGTDASRALQQEALNIRAYVQSVYGNLKVAEELAEKAARLGGEAERNLRLVRNWHTTRKNQRGPVTNPFLELGLDHGSSQWEKRTRELYRRHEGDPSRQAEINEAGHRIDAAAGSDSGFEVFFSVPLEPERFLMPDRVPRHLVPPLQPMPRRTDALSSEGVEVLRERAAVELLQDFRVTPPTLDRHRRSS
ncbi:hypothetical protein ABZ686_00170 [Streptomyces sp. NPDC006992]|uniref:hypothetical protein n=1 Tax=Streptomyces sp. NPDC006992 TaxID=3155601 RepID=UPI0033CAD326